MGRNTLFFLGFAALVAAAFWLFRRDLDVELFFEGFRNVRPALLAAAILGNFASYAIRALRWQILLASLKRIRLTDLVNATVLGFSAIYTLGRAGELVRPVWIARKEKISTTGSFAAILLERVFDLLLLLLLFAISLAFVDLPIGAEGTLSILRGAAWMLLMGSVIALVASTLFHRYVETAAGWFAEGRIRRFLETFAQGLAAASGIRTFTLAVGYSVLLWLGIALQFWLMLLGLNLDLPLSNATLVMVATALGSIAQVPGIGGGFQAGFVFSLNTFFVIPVETAVAASLMAWVVTYAPTLLAAAIYMMWKGISTHELIAQKPS